MGGMGGIDVIPQRKQHIYLKAFPKKGKLSFYIQNSYIKDVKDLTSIKFQTISYKKINIYLIYHHLNIF